MAGKSAGSQLKERATVANWWRKTNDARAGGSGGRWLNLPRLGKLSPFAICVATVIAGEVVHEASRDGVAAIAATGAGGGP